MTLPSSHRIRNSSPGGLKSSTISIGHGGSPQYWIFTSERWRWRNILFLRNLKLLGRKARPNGWDLNNFWTVTNYCFGISYGHTNIVPQGPAITKQTIHIDLIMDQCSPTVYDVNPTLVQHGSMFARIALDPIVTNWYIWYIFEFAERTGRCFEQSDRISQRDM